MAAGPICCSGNEWQSTRSGCKLQEDGDRMATARLPARGLNTSAALGHGVQHGNSKGVYQMLDESSCGNMCCAAWPCQAHKV